MVTMGGLTEYEHEVPKMVGIAPKVVLLTAGDALTGGELGRQLAAGLPGEPVLQQVAQATGDLYAGLRRHVIERDVFGPRGITMEQFYAQGLQTRLLPPIAGAIDQQVMNFNLNLDVLLGGCDDGGAHLFSVHNPGGGYFNWQSIGFHAVGSGQLHAVQALIGFGHTASRALKETIFHVYVAKRRAEAAPGVGNDTDLAVVDHGGLHSVPAKLVAQLKALYDKFEQPAAAELMDEVKSLKFLEEDKK
jgi:hypothetical protein